MNREPVYAIGFPVLDSRFLARLGRGFRHAVCFIVHYSNEMGIGAAAMNETSAVHLLKETFSEWSEDKVPRLAAALAYYTAFALAPLLLIAIAVAGLIFGREAATNQIGQQLSGLLGPSAAESVNTMVAAAGANQGGGLLASI